MFLRFLKKSNFPPKHVASAFHTSLPSQYKIPKPATDFSLLSPFDKSKTLQALNQAHQATLTQQNVFNPLDFKIIDKTGSTSYSQTFRAYDKESNLLFAQKKLLLGSDSSWNQLNLILKQYAVRSPHLASIYSLNFDEKNQEVNVISQVNQNTVGDYSQFMAKQDIKWTDELLLSYIQQVRFQLRALRLLNAHCEGPINPQNMFIDDKTNNLKIFDFSDFQIGTENFAKENSDQFLDAALLTLVQSLNPDISCKSIDQAKSYLSRTHPSFYKVVQENLVLNPSMKNYSLHIPREYDAFICQRLGLPEYSSSSRVVNEMENMTEKDQKNNLRYWKELKEDCEKAESEQTKEGSLFKKLMAKISDTLFNITAKILNPSVASEIADITKSFTVVVLYVGVLLGIAFTFWMSAAFVVASIIEFLLYTVWPYIANAVKEKNNSERNDDEQSQ